MAYVALVALFLAIVNALIGWLRNQTFTSYKDFRISLLALVLSHIQLVIGLVLYFVSASGWNAIRTLGISGLNAPARLLALEHPFINIIALTLITVGWVRHKRTRKSRKKFKNIAVCYGLGLVLILSRIPWTQWLNSY